MKSLQYQSLVFMPLGAGSRDAPYTPIPLSHWGLGWAVAVLNDKIMAGHNVKSEVRYYIPNEVMAGHEVRSEVGLQIFVAVDRTAEQS